MLRNLLYKLGSIAGPLRTLRERHEFLHESQHWSAERLEGHQRRLLGELLRHGAATVPYYRRYFAERGGPIVDPDGLDQWPVIDKAILRERFADLCSERPHPEAYEYATGGSSGTPVKLMIDPEVKRWRWAAKMRNLEWMGWAPGDAIAFIGGSDFDRKRTDKLTTQLFRRASNQVWLNTFNATEAEYVEFGRFLARWKPRFLVGYASSLITFREVCQAHAELRGLRFQGIQSSAEVLHEEHKERLRDTFGAGVFDLYGQREVGNIAQNAVDAGPLLISAESIMVEVIERDGGPHIVVTDLRNRSFPLIRYDTGDLGELHDSGNGKADAGRGLPALGPITGRQAEMIHAPNGRLVHCEYFAHLFYAHQAVQQFQLAVRGDSLAVRYIADADVDLSSVLQAVRRDIDPNWNVAVERVPRFTSLPSGKHCYVVHEDAE